MVFQIGEVTGGVFGWIAENPVLGAPVGSPLLISIFIILIILLLFYLLYDSDDPFHSLFKIAAIAAVPTIIYMYSHNAYVYKEIKLDLEEDCMIKNFNDDLEVKETELIKPEVPKENRKNPFL